MYSMPVDVMKLKPRNRDFSGIEEEIHSRSLDSRF